MAATQLIRTRRTRRIESLPRTERRKGAARDPAVEAACSDAEIAELDATYARLDTDNEAQLLRIGRFMLNPSVGYFTAERAAPEDEPRLIRGAPLGESAPHAEHVPHGIDEVGLTRAVVNANADIGFVTLHGLIARLDIDRAYRRAKLNCDALHVEAVDMCRRWRHLRAVREDACVDPLSLRGRAIQELRWRDENPLDAIEEAARWDAALKRHEAMEAARLARVRRTPAAERKPTTLDLLRRIERPASGAGMKPERFLALFLFGTLAWSDAPCRRLIEGYGGDVRALTDQIRKWADRAERERADKS